MKYSSTFLGWFGKTALDFTYDHFHQLVLDLAKYYKENCSSGQKLIVGYDSRFLSRQFAEYLSSVMAEKGIKVFFSNAVVPSSVLIISSLHKKSMGTVVLTGDELDACFLGVRAYDKKGHLLTDDILEPYRLKRKKSDKLSENLFQKWIQKGSIEPFDPTICYENHIDYNVNFSSIFPSTNRILLNPLYGSGVYYFDHLFMKQPQSKDKVLGYSINSLPSPTLGDETPVPSMHIEETYKYMISRGAELGFILSPDCTFFEFLFGPHTLSTQEKLYFIAEHLQKKYEDTISIVVADNLTINETAFSDIPSKIEFVDSKGFYEKIKNEQYTIAIDHLGRFYFEYHGAPDALLCGFYLVEVFNNKSVTPNLLHRKLEKIKSFTN